MTEDVQDISEEISEEITEELTSDEAPTTDTASTEPLEQLTEEDPFKDQVVEEPAVATEVIDEIASEMLEAKDTSVEQLPTNLQTIKHSADEHGVKMTAAVNKALFDLSMITTPQAAMAYLPSFFAKINIQGFFGHKQTDWQWSSLLDSSQVQDASVTNYLKEALSVLDSTASTTLAPLTLSAPAKEFLTKDLSSSTVMLIWHAQTTIFILMADPMWLSDKALDEALSEFLLSASRKF
jgi:hypothetical protein